MRGVYKWQVIKFLSTLFPLPLHVVSTCYKQVLHILIHIVYPQIVENSARLKFGGIYYIVTKRLLSINTIGFFRLFIDFLK